MSQTEHAGRGQAAFASKTELGQHMGVAETFQGAPCSWGLTRHMSGGGLARAAAQVSLVAVTKGKAKCKSERFNFLVYLGNSLFSLFLILLRETEAWASR